ncbi:hypothetical protein [Kitasatospora sp. NPDC059571]|uniref:hypothetical protein n=1 Tax=Kitasatospora sp. NPDC059571 TaxID=3346871 RepID=UPI0036C979CA
MRTRAAVLIVVSAALLTACGSSGSSPAGDARQNAAKWYASGGDVKISALASATHSVLSGIDAMDSGGYSQIGLTNLTTRCVVLADKVRDAQAYAPFPEEKTQYSWSAALGQLDQGASACRDAVTARGDVRVAVRASESTLTSGLTNLKAVLEAVGTPTASPAP